MQKFVYSSEKRQCVFCGKKTNQSIREEFGRVSLDIAICDDCEKNISVVGLSRMSRAIIRNFKKKLPQIIKAKK